MRHDVRYLLNRVWLRQLYCKPCDDFSKVLLDESDSWWNDWQEWKCQTCNTVTRISIERGNM